MSNIGEIPVKDVYADLLHLGNNNGGLSSSLLPVQSGSGQDSGIKLSSSQVEVNFAEGQCIKPEIKSLRYTYYHNTGVGGSSYSVDLGAANIQKLTLNSNLTNLVFTNVPSSGVVGWIRLIIERVIYNISNWPSGCKWPSGSALNLSSTLSNTTTIVDFWTVDGGSTWYAYTVAQTMS